MHVTLAAWFLQTWLLSAQVLSTREFAQLAVRKFLPTVAPWFAIVFVPLGFALDGALFHFPVSIGVMGALYIAAYVLRSEPWEHVWFGGAISMAYLGLQLWQFGWVPHVWKTVTVLVLLLFMITLILRRYQNFVGIALTYTIPIAVEFALWTYGKDSLACLSVAMMTAIMTGLYVEFRIRQDRVFRESKRASEHDELTDALTRRGLKKWRDECEQSGVRSGMIIFCDIDNFKWMNDTWGHNMGDIILKQFAERMQSGLRPGDALVRFGGDEFQMWIPLKDPSDAEKIAMRLHWLATRGVYDIPGGKGLQVGISMGWSYGPLDETTAIRADAALLHAKECGKNCVMRDELEIKSNKLEDTQKSGTEPQLYWLTNVANALWRDSHYAYVLTDTQGNIQTANEAYMELVGKTWPQLKGQKPGINSACKTPPEVYSEMWRSLSEGKTWRGCLLNRREDGTEWWELAELFPVIQAGQTIGYWGLVQDLAGKGQFPQARALVTKQSHFWPGRIHWVFQPIVDMHAQTVIGYEALARPFWGNSPVTPETFFQVADKFNTHMEADWACLDSLLDHMEHVHSWPAGQRLFVNLYMETLNDTERLRDWLRELQKRLPGVICVFEIMESHIEFMKSTDWDWLRTVFPDVEWAQDDFGAGEKDVLRLCSWKPEWLKLDRSLVQQASEDPDTLRLIEALNAWATRKEIRVIPEGIETAEQAQILQSCGIHQGQGYFWSKPLDTPNFSLLRFLSTS